MSHIISELYDRGAKNINWVGGEPTPNLLVILETLKISKNNIAQVWNSNFYFSEKTLEILLDLIDLWLPDFKYGSDDCAKRLSGIPNYTKTIQRNIKKTYDNVTNGLSSMIIRHLVLPNHFQCCTKPILEWISKETPLAMVNIMDQYRPQHLVFRDEKYSDISRTLYKEEIERAYQLAENLNLNWKIVTK